MIGPLIRALIRIYGPTVAKTLFQAAKNVIKGSGANPLNDLGNILLKKQEFKKMTQEEAKKILGVGSNDLSDLDYQYKKLFSLNDPARGGSFYLQCKVIGAFETLNKKK